MAKTIYSIICPVVLPILWEAVQAGSKCLLSWQGYSFDCLQMALKRHDGNGGVGAGGRRNTPNSPASLGLLQPGSGRRWHSQNHPILSLLPALAQNALVSGAEKYSLKAGGGAVFGVDDAMSSHPLLSGSSHLLQLLAAGSAGILLQRLSGHRPHLWEAFWDCTLSPTPIPFSKPCFFSLGWGDGTLDSFRNPCWRRRERCGPENGLGVWPSPASSLVLW